MGMSNIAGVQPGAAGFKDKGLAAESARTGAQSLARNRRRPLGSSFPRTTNNPTFGADGIGNAKRGWLSKLFSYTGKGGTIFSGLNKMMSTSGKTLGSKLTGIFNHSTTGSLRAGLTNSFKTLTTKDGIASLISGGSKVEEPEEIYAI